MRTAALVGIRWSHVLVVLRTVCAVRHWGSLYARAMTVMRCGRADGPRSNASGERDRNRRYGDDKGDHARQDCSIANHKRPSVRPRVTSGE
jgi:hypothetical protein